MQEIPLQIIQPDQEPCCGRAIPPPADEHARPGYRICHFVKGFLEAKCGTVPIVATELNFNDWLGILRARVGWRRDTYLVSPGLYAIGSPDHSAPVLVTANYKLSFDTLRKNLGGIDTWILVLDTRGVNVWCAASHQTFGTDELVRQIDKTGLSELVGHKKLIVPQLGATGVSAFKVNKARGFEVIWGPIRAEDLPAFLSNGNQASPEMRKLTFSLGERMVLSPVELSLALKPTALSLLAILVISGIGPGYYSLTAAWHRWLMAVPAFISGLLAGAVLLPAFLPVLPGRPFYLKGFVAAIPVTLALGWALQGVYKLEIIALVLLCLAVSSYAGMNFTGATPYASPSGVEKEMRTAIPIQIVLVITALACWVAAPFMM